MITDLSLTAHDLVVTAADIVTRSLLVGEQISAGPLITEVPDLPFQHAVVVSLAGAATGELALYVDNELADALDDSDISGMDLAAALGSVFEQLSRSLGSVILGVPQAMAARVATARIGGFEQAGYVLVSGSAAPRGAVAIGLTPSADEPGGTPGFTQFATASVASPERLDLLRGVEMAASVELGRATMTINGLLTLHHGAIIELDRAAGEPADLFVNGRLIARGEVVVVDENYALRVIEILPGEQSR